MYRYYKVRAIIKYVKDESGNDTENIDTIEPICRIPFIGATNKENSWYLIKTNTELAESDDVILIPEDELQLHIAEFNLNLSTVQEWCVL